MKFKVFIYVYLQSKSEFKDNYFASTSLNLPLIHLCFLIFLKGLIFSVLLTFSQQYLHHSVSLWCVLLNQGEYSEIHFYQKSLNTPLMFISDGELFKSHKTLTIEPPVTTIIYFL